MSKKVNLDKKRKLAGEVYDLLIQKYDPNEVKGLPSRKSFIRDNVEGVGKLKPTSIKDLKNYKKELQTYLGKTKPVKAPAAPKAKPARKDKPEKPTYTVMGETFATLKEAKAAAKIVRDRKPCEIKESNKKPTHKVVSFIAKSK